MDAARKVVFIAGFGRSGSTLLERVLGAAPEALPAGELCFFGERVLRRDGVCACGKAVEDCPLWSGIVRRVREDEELASALAGEDAFGSFGSFWSLSGTRWRSPDAYAAYRRALRALYDIIWDASQRTVLVDSSKYWTYARVLRESLDCPVHLVHLVRDPRGNVRSWRKEVPYEEVEGETVMMRRHTLPGSIVRWWLHHAGTRLLASRAASYTLVRYEDFCRAPADEVRRITDAAGMEFPEEVFRGTRTLALPPSHQVAGNPLRFESTVELQEDTSWREDQSPVRQRTIRALCEPLMTRLGY